MKIDESDFDFRIEFGEDLVASSLFYSIAMDKPTYVDICTFIGTFGLFLTLFLLFVRFLPMIALSEVKAVVANREQHEKHGHGSEEVYAIRD